MRSFPAFNAVLLCCLLPACDQIAELDGSKAAEAEGKATGGACRHAGRALEDCYALNEKASRSAVFAGWREMNDYMTQNKIDPVLPVEPLPGKKPTAKTEDAAAAKSGVHADSPMTKRSSLPHETGTHSSGLRPGAASAMAGSTKGGVDVPDIAQVKIQRTPQETAAALFLPPDATAAAVNLPAKVVAGKAAEKSR